MKIPFNKPHLTGKEAHYMYDAVYGESKLSGNGKYTRLCQEFFQQRYSFSKCLLTTSCTDALEMAAILLDLKPGDEVIMPSYTFVSTANAFVLREAHLVFCGSTPNQVGFVALAYGRTTNIYSSPRAKIALVHRASVL